MKMMQSRARISSRRLSSMILLLFVAVLLSKNALSFSVHPFVARKIGTTTTRVQRPSFHCQSSFSNKLFQTTKNEQNTSEEEIPTKPEKDESEDDDSFEKMSKKNYVDNLVEERKVNRGFLSRIRLLRGRLPLPLKRNKRQTLVLCLITSALIIVAVAAAISTNYHPASWMPTIDLNQANQQLKVYLNRLNNAGMVGLVLYAILLWTWTITVGITTPVETAAGFCFGAQKAIPASAVGKIGGALTAFYLGRYIFQEKARKMLHQNQFLELVQESATEHPFPVAVMTRFAPLPEFVKNFGMSMTQIPLRSFAVAVILHGLPFTCLWSCMGAETAKLVALQQGAATAAGATPSKALKVMVTGMTWFGAVLSPTLMGWWIRSLRKKAAAKSTTTSSSTSSSTSRSTEQSGEEEEEDR